MSSYRQGPRFRAWDSHLEEKAVKSYLENEKESSICSLKSHEQEFFDSFRI